MDLTRFTKKLNETLMIELFDDYCPNGLQVEGRPKLKHIATAVSANLPTIEAAVNAGVDALVTHHGLFWKRDPYPIVGSKKTKVELLLKNEISLLGYHLPLDAHQTLGNNWVAARALGWENLEPFREIGVQGELSMTIDQLIEKVEAYYGHTAARALGGKKEVSRVALISGGAYRELAAAAQEGIDCFITGNFDEPAWGVAHEEKINFLALGHSATERVGPQALARYIEKELGVKATFLDIANPF